MTTRNCKGCRHYISAGYDNMGWCNHPKRTLTSDAKVFVRGAQLPCRNDWAQDLFEVRLGEPASAGFGDGVDPMPTQPYISFDVEQPSGRSPAGTPISSSAVDMVVGETTKIVGGERTDVDRSPLRRAHEELRAKKRFELGARKAPEGFAQGIDDFQLPGASRPAKEAPAEARKPLDVDEVVGPNGVDAGGAVADDFTSAPPPVGRDDVSRRFPKIASFLEDDDQFSSVPTALEGFDLPRLEDRAGPAVIRTTVSDGDFDKLFPPEVPDFDQIDGRETRSPADDTHAHRPSSFADANRSADRGRTIERGTGAPTPSGSLAIESDHEVNPGHQAHSEAFTEAELAEWAGEDLFPPADLKPEHAGRSRLGRFRRARIGSVQSTEMMDAARDILPDSADAEAEIWAAPNSMPRDHVIDDILVEAEDRPVESALWATVPRACRTCRDFRPSESGDRGWCTNKWAFSHRRMVDAEEIPCETSVGCWWLPHDDVWMTTGDVSLHSQPTPLFDLWIAARYAAEVEREALRNPERRRQRS